jgi:hypothetical protein
MAEKCLDEPAARDEGVPSHMAEVTELDPEG